MFLIVQDDENSFFLYCFSIITVVKHWENPFEESTTARKNPCETNTASSSWHFAFLYSLNMDKKARTALAVVNKVYNIFPETQAFIDNA